jgi:hypothetical protein
MKMVWFKQKFVEPILRKQKINTVRKKSSRNPAAGDIVGFQVGPRTPFCMARIKEIRPIAVSDLPTEHQQDVFKCFNGRDLPEMVQIFFEIL